MTDLILLQYRVRMGDYIFRRIDTGCVHSVRDRGLQKWGVRNRFGYGQMVTEGFAYSHFNQRATTVYDRTLAHSQLLEQLLKQLLQYDSKDLGQFLVFWCLMRFLEQSYLLHGCILVNLHLGSRAVQGRLMSGCLGLEDSRVAYSLLLDNEWVVSVC
jgi:hypothetical protein